MAVTVADVGVEDGLFAIEASDHEDDLRLRIVFIGSLSSEKDPEYNIGCGVR